MSLHFYLTIGNTGTLISKLNAMLTFIWKKTKHLWPLSRGPFLVLLSQGKMHDVVSGFTRWMQRLWSPFGRVSVDSGSSLSGLIVKLNKILGLNFQLFRGLGHAFCLSTFNFCLTAFFFSFQFTSHPVNSHSVQLWLSFTLSSLMQDLSGQLLDHGHIRRLSHDYSSV